MENVISQRKIFAPSLFGIKKVIGKKGSTHLMVPITISKNAIMKSLFKMLNSHNPHEKEIAVTSNRLLFLSLIDFFYLLNFSETRSIMTGERRDILNRKGGKHYGSFDKRRNP